MRIALGIEYNGSGFCGWQSQPSGCGVQDHLETALNAFLAAPATKVGVICAGRIDATVASLPLSEGALATSGDYERYFEHEGRRYCHVLDPRTGWPVSAWRSISVVAPVCVAAGAVCTIAMLKAEEGLDFLRSQALGFLAIDASGQQFNNAG